MRYRADIDGLRSIAVLAVVLFHLSLPGFEGGYVGVDVFFVISGFLITSLIIGQIETNTFSLRDFYSRRIRRLLPPLIATVFFTAVVSLLILNPIDMQSFGRSSASALLSISNFIFYLESGYWDSASELKPLLHTWSLSIEEQFYLFWPLTIVFFCSISKTFPLSISIFLVSVLSFIGCVIYTPVNQAAAFYLLPFRIFEFGLGALVPHLAIFIFTDKVSRNRVLSSIFCWIGLLLIFLSVANMANTTSFPGWVVLIPAIGSALVILSGCAPIAVTGLPKLLLENKYSAALGKLSYALYLTHWPIISLYRYKKQDSDLSTSEQMLLGLTIFITTLALHWLIEKRFYRRKYEGKDRTNCSLDFSFAIRTICVSLLLALILFSAWLTDGWSWRFSNNTLDPETVELEKQNRFEHIRISCRINFDTQNEKCDYSKPIQILVLGNSVEPDGFNFIKAATERRDDVALISFGNTNHCEEDFINSLQAQDSEFVPKEKCSSKLNALLSSEKLSSINIILYSSNNPFSANKNHIVILLEELKRRNPSIYVMTLGGYINTKRHCSHYIFELGDAKHCIDEKHVQIFSDNPERHRLYNDIMSLTNHFIDRIDLLCPGRKLENCAYQTTSGIPFMLDSFHQSRDFAEYSGRLYSENVSAIIDAIIKDRQD